MKIHEQEWSVSTREPCNVVSGDAVIAVVLAYKDTEERDLSRFISAAPKMARALLALGRFIDANNTRWHSELCIGNEKEECEPECVQAQDALRSAGVL